ncbi:hypothetical protein HMPREF3202_00958 [Prevotella bivia]|uniref:Uncharacterized protein n=1 Tax=Prevotella bivia TaxID=28125 RepID=A0A137SZ10_9BACT|nr:hypothetical protein HMPREF3202_00958 [Prevotella bivia]
MFFTVSRLVFLLIHGYRNKVSRLLYLFFCLFKGLLVLGS